MIKMTVQEAVEKRYSTRNYDPNKKIGKEDLNLILSAGLKAPNGLGFEGWLFYVLNGNKANLRLACKDQEHIETSSHVIALVNFKAEYVAKNPHIIIDKLISNGLIGEKLELYKSRIPFVTTQYYREQLMFACSQMILQATALNIGSVAVGGFDKNEVAKLINLDTDNFEVGQLLSLGYNLDKTPKVRNNRKFEDVVKEITFK
jgi:nitroreductase